MAAALLAPLDFSMRHFLRYVARLDHYDTIVRSTLGDKPFLEIVYEDMVDRYR